MDPYPGWLSPGDNAWQLVAATLVGLMSIPGVAVLYGGLVARKWVVNTMIMVFTGFCLVLVVWVLWGFEMSFGHPLVFGPGILGGFVGHPGTVLGQAAEQGRASIPLLTGLVPELRFPKASLVYFQFAFAAITPVLFLGSLVGRINFKAWLLFVPLWSTFAYTVNAFLLWGGGFWAQHGALDYSGGYVIHLAAGTSGFIAAAVIGPRLARDRAHGVPNNLMMVAVGAGILWLGWNGFNGGDMYFAGANASAAVLNTNLGTAAAVLTWVVLDMLAGPQRKPTFLGAVNGMITGLVAITAGAGYVNGVGALLTGVIASGLVWLSWNRLSRLRLFRRVDDALAVVHTHGVAGLSGGLLVGLFADPGIIVYHGVGGASDVSYSGLFYGNPKQLAVQLGAAVTIVVWDGLVTFVLLKLVALVVPLRLPRESLHSGDLAVHDEEAYPPETLVAEGSSTGPGRVRTAAVSEAQPYGGRVVVRLTRNPESDGPAYFFVVEGPGLRARLPVYRNTAPEQVRAKETYHTELLGREIERANLPSLESAVRQVLAESVSNETLPRYVLHSAAGMFVPVFRRGRGLRALVRGRWVDGADLSALHAAVARSISGHRGTIGPARDPAVLSIAPEDLAGTPSIFAFRHRDLWVPVFPGPYGGLGTAVADQEVEGGTGLPGVLGLRHEVARVLRASGRLYDALDLAITGVSTELWADWESGLGEPERFPVGGDAEPLRAYRYGDEVLAAMAGSGGDVDVWFGRNQFDLAARIEMATRPGRLAGALMRSR